MQLSQLVAAFQKVQQIAGDIPVALNVAESLAESEAAALHISLPLNPGHTATVSIGKHVEPASGEQGGLTDPQAPPAA